MTRFVGSDIFKVPHAVWSLCELSAQVQRSEVSSYPEMNEALWEKSADTHGY